MMARTRKPASAEPAEIMGRVSVAIAARRLGYREAAAEIGVTLNTLERHLTGEHVRYDSARKYEDWLAGRTERRSVFRHRNGHQQEALALPPPAEPEGPPPPPPGKPHLVVDIFSGCGGLSLGFDLFEGGRYFRTVLALDVQTAPVAVMLG